MVTSKHRSRGKRAAINTIAELLLELVTAICAFILPRLILSHYGSANNGIVSSITQFIGCVAILKSGIGSVTRVALYRPLANGDYKTISSITNATSIFMRKIAFLFVIFTLSFSVIYPFAVNEDFSWLFTFSLVMILASSTFAQYFFGLTFQMVLEADQKNYIISIISILTTIINTIISSILIMQGYDIRVVKLFSALVFILPPIFYNIYVRKKYSIDASVKPDNKLIDQRWDAFGHQIANFVNTNTDIMVATVCLGVKEVSVYSVFYLIGHAIQRGVRAFSTGTTAAFGNMIAKDEEEHLKRNYRNYEFLITYISTVIISVAVVMITSFISLYTRGVSDVDYIRCDFGILMCIATYLTGMKLPCEQMINASGSFRKTKKYAYIEAALNIIISVVLSLAMGLNGIIIGTIVAALYKIATNNHYVSRYILKTNGLRIYRNMGYSLICFLAVGIVSLVFPLQSIGSYVEWGLFSVAIMSISIITSSLFAILFMKDDFVSIISRIIGLAKRKK